MTTDEAKRFLSEVAFVAFPTVREWLRQTENGEKTGAMWCKALADLHWQECETAIGRWVSGEVPPPRFLRDTFIAELRSCVMFERAKIARRNQQQELSDLIGKPAYHPTQSDIYLREWVPRLLKVQAGELSEAVAKEEWRLILEREIR